MNVMNKDTNPQPTPAQSNVLSTNPPPTISAGNGGDVLPAGQRLRPRKYTTVDPKLQVSDVSEFTQEGYIGQNLVDDKGTIARAQYSEDEAYAILAGKSPGERRAFLNRFAAIGLYGDRKPTLTGLDSLDLGVVRDAMRVANAEGYTLEAVQPILATQYPKAQATGRRFRPSPKADLRTVFKRTAGELLGRQLNDEEVERFVKAYIGMEATEAAGGVAAPSAAVAAEQQVMRRQGAEAAAVGALQLAQIMDQKIKALG